MISKSLIRLVDEAVFPAIILVAGKVISLGIIIYGYHISVELSLSQGSFFPSLIYASQHEAMITNSYSNLVMYGIIFLGFFWVVAKSIHFHDSHLSPKAAMKLAQWNLLKLVEGSFSLYHQAIVWFCFLWIAAAILIFYSASGFTFWWITGLSLVLNVILTYLLIDDIEHEFWAWRVFKNGYS